MYEIKSEWKGKQDAPDGVMELSFDGVVYAIPLRSFQEYYAIQKWKDKSCRAETAWAKEQLKHLYEEL